MPGHGGIDYDSGGSGTSSGSYTDEQAQDAVGTILVSTTSIAATYDDAANQITFDVKGVDASAVANFNETAQDAVGTILSSTSTVAFTYDDAGNTISAGAVIAQIRAAMGRLEGQTVCTATATSVYTVPSGVQCLLVEGVAGGGGGAGSAGSSTLAAIGGGGGSGGYFRKLFTATATAYTYIIGQKGTGGAAGANNGNSGTNTTFGAGVSLLTAFAGGGGFNMATGTNVAITSGGDGGAVSTGGDVNAGGTSGEAGMRANASSTGFGAGANSYFAGGGLRATNNTAGSAATAPGAGGSGGRVESQNNARAGGDGANGIIIITEFY